MLLHHVSYHINSCVYICTLPQSVTDCLSRCVTPHDSWHEESWPSRRESQAEACTFVQKLRSGTIIFPGTWNLFNHSVSKIATRAPGAGFEAQICCKVEQWKFTSTANIKVHLLRPIAGFGCTRCVCCRRNLSESETQVRDLTVHAESRLLILVCTEHAVHVFTKHIYTPLDTFTFHFPLLGGDPTPGPGPRSPVIHNATKRIE